jgi:uncharacterized protein (TIRG00374 family)
MRLWLIRLLGVLLLIFILTRIDLSSVASTIAKVNLWYLALVVALMIPVIFLKSWRWQTLLRMQGLHYPLWQAFLAFFGSLNIGLATPGRLGEFSRVFYLVSDKGLSFSTAFSSVLVDRLFDVYFLLLAAGVGLITIPSVSANITLSVIILVVLLTIPFLLLQKRIGIAFIRLVAKFKPLHGFGERLTAAADQFYAGIAKLASPGLIVSFLITAAAYAILFLQWKLLALSLGLALPFLYVAAYMSVANLLALLPISIAGLGTRDAALIGLFSLHGISVEGALSYSLLVLFAFYICAAAMSAVAWQLKPLPTARGKT